MGRGTGFDERFNLRARFAAQFPSPFLQITQNTPVASGTQSEGGGAHPGPGQEGFDLGDKLDLVGFHGEGFYSGNFRHASGKFRLGHKTTTRDYPVTMPDTQPDPVRTRLVELSKERNISLRELSKRLGRAPGYLNDFVKKTSPATLDMADAIKLAHFLEVEPSHLGVENVLAVRTQPIAPQNVNNIRSVPGEPGADRWKPDLKVLGFVKAGRVGYYPDNGETLEMTARPPMLAGVPDGQCYAVYIDDVSMVPALKPGYIAWVHTRRPAMPGDNIVIELTDGQAFVKELVRRTEKHLICKQWNPEEEIRFDQAKVRAVHLVVGSGKGIR